MAVGLDRRPADPAEQFAEAGVARQVAAHDERVDEEPDQPFELGTSAPGDRRPDREIVLPRVAVEENLKCCQQRHVQRRALALDRALERLQESPSATVVDRSPPRWLAIGGRGRSVGSSSRARP